MNRSLASLTCAGALLCAAPAKAQSMVLTIVDAPGLSEAPVRRVKKVAEDVLRERSAWRVGESPDWKKGAPRRGCGPADQDCQLQLARAAGAPAVVLLWLKSNEGGVGLEAALWLDGERAGAVRSGSASFESLETGLRPVLDGLLPGWAKKGWGGLRLGEAEGATLKVDGRPVEGGAAVLSVTAGAHQVDVVSSDGSAVLQKVEVVEGTRTRVEAPAATDVSASGLTHSHNEKLRYFSYGLWVAGSASIAASFIVGYVGRQTAVGANPCRPDSRECLTYEQAAERNQAAQGYARSATALLWVGISLALAGAGLFAWDELF